MKNWRIILAVITVLAITVACSLFVPSGKTNEPTGTSGLVAHPSGFVTSVTMAMDTQGSLLDPVDPTTVFAATDTFHAVVAIENAPNNTTFKAVWYTVDVGSASDNNSEIDASQITSDGTRNLDFSLTPVDSWQKGTYQVEIYVNATLDQIVDFSVR